MEKKGPGCPSIREPQYIRPPKPDIEEATVSPHSQMGGETRVSQVEWGREYVEYKKTHRRYMVRDTLQNIGSSYIRSTTPTLSLILSCFRDGRVSELNPFPPLVLYLIRFVTIPEEG